MRNFKLTKKEITEMSLTRQEMHLIKGGQVDDGAINKNESYQCSCTYKNQSIIYNTNTVMGCKCLCV
jgi:hypothetical protein